MANFIPNPRLDLGDYKQQGKMWQPGYVYVIDYGDGVTFKIGFTTTTPEVRINQIAKGSVIMPMHLVMSGYTNTNAYFLENLLQMHFDDNHVRGEWFKLDFTRLVELYQSLAAFSVGVKLYDRWYDLVPNNLDELLDENMITSHVPPFVDKRVKVDISDWSFLEVLDGE
jgi:hypothetical protein